MENTMNIMNPTPAMASARRHGLGRCVVGGWEATHVMERNTSVDARERFATTGQLDLVSINVTSKQFAIAYVPGTHAWSPPIC